jgi:hypothetical protein
VWYGTCWCRDKAVICLLTIDCPIQCLSSRLLEDFRACYGMCVKWSNGNSSRAGFPSQVVRLQYEEIGGTVSGHALIEGKDVKEQADNKGRCLVSYDALIMPAIDCGLALVSFFEGEPNLPSASLSFFDIATWSLGLRERVSSA